MGEITQDISYWESKKSLKRYSNIEKLFDIEKVFILDAVEKLDKLPQEIRILDVGCGGGRTTKALLRLGFDVVGIDIARNLINYLQKEIGVKRAIVGDAAKLNFSKNYFDIVLFSHNGIDCLYPISKRQKAFKEINRVLKSGGYFIYSSHIFQLTPFNRHTTKTILRNLINIPKLLNKGYYVEYIDGSLICLYSVSKLSEATEELKSSGFLLKKHSTFINEDKNILKNILKASLSWERYYLAKKNK